MTSFDTATSPDQAHDVLEAVGYGRTVRRGLLIEQEAGKVLMARLQRDADGDDLAALLEDERRKVLAWFWPVPGLEPLGRLPRDPGDSNRRRAGGLYRAWIRQAADLTGRSPRAVRAHVCWSAHIGDDMLERVLGGDELPNIHLALRLVYALRLHLAAPGIAGSSGGSWVFGDVDELQRAVDRSMRDTRTLTELIRTEVSTARRADASVREGVFYPAPKRASRYFGLYQYLCDQRGDRISVPLDVIEAVVGPLPKAARASRSWWSGDGLNTERRPQVAAWWGAGLRVDRWFPDQVEFVPLPGRSYGMSDKGFRVGGLARGPVPAVTEPLLTTDLDADEALSQVVRVIGETERTRQELFRTLNPDAPAVIRLDDTSLGNLLTRARRAGVIVNHGSRRAPRWMVAGGCADYLAQIFFELGLPLPPLRGPSGLEWQDFHLAVRALAAATEDVDTYQGSHSGGLALRRLVLLEIGHTPPESLSPASLAVLLEKVRGRQGPMPRPEGYSGL